MLLGSRVAHDKPLLKLLSSGIEDPQTMLIQGLSSLPGTALQAVILDCSGVAFVDSAGARLLIQVPKGRIPVWGDRISDLPKTTSVPTALHVVVMEQHPFGQEIFSLPPHYQSKSHYELTQEGGGPKRTGCLQSSETWNQP